MALGPALVAEPELQFGIADVELGEGGGADMRCEQAINRGRIVARPGFELELLAAGSLWIAQVQSLHPRHLHVLLIGQRMERYFQEIEIECRKIALHRTTQDCLAEDVKEFRDPICRPQVRLEKDGAVLRLVNEDQGERGPERQRGGLAAVGEGVEKMEPVAHLRQEAEGLLEREGVYRAKLPNALAGRKESFQPFAESDGPLFQIRKRDSGSRLRTVPAVHFFDFVVEEDLAEEG